MKTTFLTITGAIGGAVTTFLFGGWNTATATLFIFMVIDYLTGILDAVIFKNSPKTETGGLSSKVGFKGICKKVMIIFFLLIGYRLDLTIGTTYIKDGICIAFIANELLSITENATLMGFPTPPFIVNAIDILKQKSSDLSK
jgi:toxin secretion/phage lysis holin